MKKIFILFSMASLILFTACEDEVDVEGLMKYPPTIVSVTPKSTVKAGDFDIKVVFAEGPKTPLSSATLVLKDALSNEVVSVTEALTGISDSVVVKGADFDAASLGLGDYTLTIIASDVDNNEVRSEVKFKISDQLFAANHSAMYIAGVFNGWGADEMVLVADNTWEIKEVDLQGGGWKFKNTPDWSDVDWGDSNCDKVMEIATGGGPDTKCEYEGLVNIRFNDDDLKYTITPAVTFASNLPSLYLLGSFNNFQGPPDYKFALKADHTWELAEIRLKTGDIFKFAEMKTFQGKNYGDAEYDGQAEEFGPNIVIPNGTTDAFYSITFNDATLAYTLTLVRMPYLAELYIAGDASPGGWNNDAGVAMFRDPSNGSLFTYVGKLNSGSLKFLKERGQWAPQWGDGGNGELAYRPTEADPDPPGIAINATGYYTVVFNSENYTFSITPYDETGKPDYTTIGIIGTATPNGWGDPDTDMTQSAFDPHHWFIDGQALASGELKFRADDAWTMDWGSNKPMYGVGTKPGDNIPIAEAGNYLIRFCDLTGQYAVIKKPN